MRISRDLFRFGLSSAQNELLRAQQSLAELAMNIAQYTELVGRIDVERFQEVISEQVARHRAFQVRFERDGDDIVGVYDPSLSTRSEYVDLRGLDDSAGEALRRMRADFSARANPFVDRLTVGYLYQLGDERYYFYIRTHHVTADGVSAKACIENSLAAYDSAVGGSVHVPPRECDFAAAVNAEADYRASTRFVADEVYWRDQLQGMHMASSLAHGLAGLPAAVSRLSSSAVDAEVYVALEDAISQSRSTLPAMLSAAVAAWLSRAVATEDVVLNFPVAARTTVTALIEIPQ